MKIHAISDAHGFHRQCRIDDDVGLFLYGGDSTNYRELYKNQQEFEDFYDWIVNLKIPYKVVIAGNHDAWATKKYNVDKLKDAGIIYLENESVIIEGIKIFGSPITPNFNDWYFMKDRSKLDRFWNDCLENESVTIEGIKIFGSPITPNFCDWYFMKDRSKLDRFWNDCLEKDIDILLTHGPPKYILDLSHNKQHELEYCGDKALFNHIMINKPKYHIFGHIHNSDDCYNQGIRIYNDITFMNVSSVYDGRFDKGLISNGITFNFNKNEK